MKHYLKIAGKYFRHFEGRHLYPSWGNYRLWLWFLSFAVWMFSLWYFATSAYAVSGARAFPLIVVPEVIWLAITFWIRSWKDRQILEATNHKLASNFESMEECRIHILREVTAKEPPEFLEIAKEIDDLVTLGRKFRRNSDLTWAEFVRSIYDNDSKARLLTLVIVLVSTTVALSVRSEATLDAVFDLFIDPAGQRFLLLLAVIATVIFFGLIGLRVFVFTLVEVMTSWTIKLLGETVSPSWLLSYFIRDLVTYHGSDTVSEEANAESENAEAKEGGASESNVVAIDPTHQHDAVQMRVGE